MSGDRYLDPEFDDDTLPQEDDLATLAHQGELAAIGLPAAAVRRLGARRRRRRRAAVGAGALTLVVLAGGVAFGNTGTLFTQDPPVVATPTPAPSTSSVPSPPARTLTAANLLTAADVPRREDYETVEEVSEVDRSSPCVPDNDLGQLDPTTMLSTAFALVPVGPDAPSPDPDSPGEFLIVAALQFADETAARRAVATYQGWLDDCPATLPSQGYVRLGDSSEVLTTKVDPQLTGATGSFSELTYREETDDSGSGTFESTGLTRVGDRVMVTQHFLYGTEYHVSLDPEGDAETGLPAHPQFALVRASAERLSR